MPSNASEQARKKRFRKDVEAASIQSEAGPIKKDPENENE